MNNHNPEPGEQLRTLVSAEHDLLRELVEVMGTERELLLSGGELDNILTRKHTLLEQLETATQHRLQWLQRQGLPANQAELLQQLDTLDNSGLLGKEIIAFAATATQCQESNIALHPILRRRNHYLTRAAASLGLGVDPGDASYSSHGQSVAKAGTRQLGVA